MRVLLLVAFTHISPCRSFLPCGWATRKVLFMGDTRLEAESGDGSSTSTKRRGDNKAMAFLRKVGRVGGAANMDFADAMGLDESPSGGTKESHHENGFRHVRKSKSSYIPCTTSGVIDDMSDGFPFTSSGSQWQGITDKVMGGVSNGSLTRETVDGKLANVLRGKVSLKNNGGFIQMAADLSLDPGVDPFVDASSFDGIELEVYNEGEESDNFNVHLRTPACQRQFSSYRSTFKLDANQWTTIRLSWGDFKGHGPGPDETEFVPTLRRIGIVSIGEAKDVSIAVSKVGFYNVI